MLRLTKGEITPERLGVIDYSAKLLRMFMPTFCYHSESTSAVCATISGMMDMLAI